MDNAKLTELDLDSCLTQLRILKSSFEVFFTATNTQQDSEIMNILNNIINRLEEMQSNIATRNQKDIEDCVQSGFYNLTALQHDLDRLHLSRINADQ
ncbi:unnamed protein product [Caenorhabditis bovis]|uniref:Uncharacterized protein n=1 Tax=Caenorhabditis bovis TaxID=2654633 RepID=A0A8S1FFU8_9PELO|nr:unnamed protein product [Caenorhabditis bovis]